MKKYILKSLILIILNCNSLLSSSCYLNSIDKNNNPEYLTYVDNLVKVDDQNFTDLTPVLTAQSPVLAAQSIDQDDLFLNLVIDNAQTASRVQELNPENYLVVL